MRCDFNNAVFLSWQIYFRFFFLSLSRSFVGNVVAKRHHQRILYDISFSFLCFQMQQNYFENSVLYERARLSFYCYQGGEIVDPVNCRATKSAFRYHIVSFVHEFMFESLLYRLYNPMLLLLLLLDFFLCAIVWQNYSCDAAVKLCSGYCVYGCILFFWEVDQKWFADDSGKMVVYHNQHPNWNRQQHHSVTNIKPQLATTKAISDTRIHQVSFDVFSAWNEHNLKWNYTMK